MDHMDDGESDPCSGYIRLTDHMSATVVKLGGGMLLQVSAI